jgi:hypothetical protein
MLSAQVPFRFRYRLALFALIGRPAASVGFTASLQAQSYCSLSVNLIDPQGRAVDANVSVQASYGHTVEKMAVSGSVRFCDLGMNPVTVAVAHPACNQAIVRNVGLRWGETTKVKIIHDDEPRLHDAPPVAACFFDSLIASSTG